MFYTRISQKNHVFFTQNFSCYEFERENFLLNIFLIFGIVKDISFSYLLGCFAEAFSLLISS